MPLNKETKPNHPLVKNVLIIGLGWTHVDFFLTLQAFIFRSSYFTEHYYVYWALLRLV